MKGREQQGLREYLLEVMAGYVDEYLKEGIAKKNGVDGASDLCHSFFSWLENKLDTEGI